MPVRFQAFGAQHSVIENALHAVAIAAITRDAQQIARELEVRITATRRFESTMLFRSDSYRARWYQALQILRWDPNRLSRSSVSPRSSEMRCGPRRGAFHFQYREVCLNGGTERVAVAVCVMSTQYVLAGCEWVEKSIVNQESRRECAVSIACSLPPCEKQIFRQSVRLVEREVRFRNERREMVTTGSPCQRADCRVRDDGSFAEGNEETFLMLSPSLIS